MCSATDCPDLVCGPRELLAETQPGSSACTCSCECLTGWTGSLCDTVQGGYYLVGGTPALCPGELYLPAFLRREEGATGYVCWRLPDPFTDNDTKSNNEHNTENSYCSDGVKTDCPALPRTYTDGALASNSLDDCLLSPGNECGRDANGVCIPMPCRTGSFCLGGISVTDGQSGATSCFETCRASFGARSCLGCTMDTAPGSDDASDCLPPAFGAFCCCDGCCDRQICP